MSDHPDGPCGRANCHRHTIPPVPHDPPEPANLIRTELR